MTNLKDILTTNTVDCGKTIEIDKLAELVESQIDNVLGGGYSQYAAVHSKDATL
jgi:hypothetical protein